MNRTARWLSLCTLGIAASTAHAAVLQVRSVDDQVEGLNDATAFTPEGGNNAGTLGQARLNVLNEAARIWGGLITSNIPINIDASVDDLQNCTQNSGTLAAAGPASSYWDFPGAPRAGVIYPAALTEALTNTNINDVSADIRVFINSAVNGNASCLFGARFYYGFDHNIPNGRIDLLAVLLHEFGHGLGFSSRVKLDTGNGLIVAPPGGDGIERFNSYDYFIIDEALNLPWVSLTAGQRLQSAVRTGSLAWTGTNTNKWRTRYTAGVTANGRLQLYAPAVIAQGSSVSHFDTALAPDALMEPFLTSRSNNFTDLTTCALKDIGWTVTKCIDSGNTVPLALNQTITVTEDTPTNITLTGTDGDNDPITFALAGSVAHGTLSALTSPQVPTALFTPAQDSNSTETFTFTVADDFSTSVAGTVTINITPVNDAPVASPKTATVQSGQSVGITLTGTDVDGDALTFTIVSNPTSGTVTGTPPNVSYRSNDGFQGSDSFTYRANDATLQSPAVTVNVTVTPAPAKSGGGGATGLRFLALLAGLLAYARRRALRAAS